MAFTTIEHIMTNQQVEDIMDVACYGAINYWALNVEPQEDKGHGPRFKIYTEEGEQFTIGRLSIEQAMLDLWTGKISVRSDIQKAIGLAIFEEEYGEIDSTAADCIVQAACFEEIVYG
jgi:hypothetical protein